MGRYLEKKGIYFFLPWRKEDNSLWGQRSLRRYCLLLPAGAWASHREPPLPPSIPSSVNGSNDRFIAAGWWWECNGSYHMGSTLAKLPSPSSFLFFPPFSMDTTSSAWPFSFLTSPNLPPMRSAFHSFTEFSGLWMKCCPWVTSPDWKYLPRAQIVAQILEL